jgi:DNA-binding winged helix-turn-helix (wHTH) protein
VGKVYSFDQFELDVDAQQLLRVGTAIKTEALVLRLLEVFVRNPGSVITKEDLVALVWGGRAVSENALTVAIARLRKVLEEKRAGNPLILTVHGRGYRFLRAVSVRDSLPPPAAPQASTPFVGREQVIADLNTALLEAKSGVGRAIVLRGEAGIGKTRIAEVLAREAADAGLAAAWGYCREIGDTPPLWPFTGLLRDVLAALSDSTRADPCFRALLPELTILLPELASHADATPAKHEPGFKPSSKHRVFDAVVRSIALAAEHRPHLLILDDLHQADDASLELLQYLLPALPRTRILLLATVRSDGPLAVDPRLARVLSHRNAGQVPLRPLNEAQVGSYVAALFEDADNALCQAVFKISEGNPFYMVELVRQLRANPLLDAAQLTIPTAALELIRQRFARLSEPARDTLTLAAAIGRKFSLTLLQAVTGHNLANLMSHLDEAIAKDLLKREHESSTEFSFTHELLRAALYDALSAADRRSLHLRMVRTLDERQTFADMPISDIAYHARCALPEGDLRKTVQYCIDAADAATRVYAFTDAARHLQHARDALDLIENASPRLRFALLFRQAILVRGHSGRRFMALAEQLLHLAREQKDGISLAQAALLLDPFPGFPRLPIVRDALADALTGLAPGEPSMRAALLARLASSVPLAYDAAASSAQLEHALRLAKRSPQAVDRFSTRFGELYLYGGPAHKARAAETMTEMQRMCNKPASSGPLPRILLDLHRAITALQRGDVPTATRALERCESRARDLESELVWHFKRFRVLTILNQGNRVEARAALRKLHCRAQSAGPVGAELFCAYDHSLSASADPMPAAWQRALQPDAYDQPNIWALKVRALAANGSLDEARSALTLVPAQRLSHLPCDREYLGTLGALSRAALSLNAEEYTRTLYGLLSPYPDHFAVNLSFYCEGSVSHLLGLLARSFGDRERAARHFEKAVLASERAGLLPSASEAQMERSQSSPRA